MFHHALGLQSGQAIFGDLETTKTLQWLRLVTFRPPKLGPIQLSSPYERRRAHTFVPMRYFFVFTSNIGEDARHMANMYLATYTTSATLSSGLLARKIHVYGC